jgi:hypothetical protein
VTGAIVPPAPAVGGHKWIVYDPEHRACEICGLRLFWRGFSSGRGSWCLLSWNGVPSYNGLFDGGCTPPPARETVLIEYTGHPDVHPGCERIMHRVPEATGPAELVDPLAQRPACGWRCAWWEIGPARSWHGWNWCPDCFPTRAPLAGKRQRRPEPPAAELAPPEPPALPPAKPAKKRRKRRKPLKKP